MVGPCPSWVVGGPVQLRALELKIALSFQDILSLSVRSRWSPKWLCFIVLSMVMPRNPVPQTHGTWNLPLRLANPSPVLGMPWVPWLLCCRYFIRLITNPPPNPAFMNMYLCILVFSPAFFHLGFQDQSTVEAFKDLLKGSVTGFHNRGLQIHLKNPPLNVVQPTGVVLQLHVLVLELTPLKGLYCPS